MAHIIIYMSSFLCHFVVLLQILIPESDLFDIQNTLRIELVLNKHLQKQVISMKSISFKINDPISLWLSIVVSWLVNKSYWGS